MGGIWIASYCKKKNILIINSKCISPIGTGTYFKKSTIKPIKKIVNILNKKGENISISNIYSLNKITYGADIEFEGVKNNIPAREFPSYSSYINRTINKNDYFLGCINRSTSKQIGLDLPSSGPIELRPTQGTNEQDLTNNFKILFKKLKNDESRNRHKFSVIGDYFPLGGHIHFGINRRLEPSSLLLKSLDFYIGKKLRNLSGNGRGSYNTLSAYETKPYGFEYRTPPAAYCENPKIFCLIFKIARLVFLETVINEKKLSKKGKDVATKLDYIKLGLKESEVNYLNKWKKEYKKSKSYKNNIIKNWA